MAPEVYTADTAPDGGGEATATAMYSTAIDIFSLGLVYYFVFARELPRIQDATNARRTAALRSGRRPDFSSDTPKSARAVIAACWETEPAKRPSAGEIVDWWCEIEATSGGCGFGRGSVAANGLPPSRLGKNKRRDGRRGARARLRPPSPPAPSPLRPYCPPTTHDPRFIAIGRGAPPSRRCSSCTPACASRPPSSAA